MTLLKKTFIIFTVSTAVLLGIIILVFTRIESEKLNKDLDNKIKYNQFLYKDLISSLLFDLNEDKIFIALNSLLHDKDIRKIELEDYSNTVNLDIKGKKFSTSYISKFELIYDNEKLGMLYITYTKDNINELLSEYISNLIILSIIFTMLLFTLSLQNLPQS